MRTFIFNLALLIILIFASVMLLRPLAAAYKLASEPIAQDQQPSSITPQLPDVEYGVYWFTDYLMTPPELQNELPPVIVAQ